MMNSVPSGFWQWISSLNSDDIVGMIVVVSLCCVGAIAIGCATIHKIHKTRTEDALKRELLDRGLTADEIATVIGAKPEKCASHRLTRP